MVEYCVVAVGKSHLDHCVLRYLCLWFVCVIIAIIVTLSWQRGGPHGSKQSVARTTVIVQEYRVATLCYKDCARGVSKQITTAVARKGVLYMFGRKQSIDRSQAITRKQ